MSNQENQEVNSSAITPQHSTITSTTSEDDSAQNKLDIPKNINQSNFEKNENNNQNKDEEYENCIESEIKSPTKSINVSSSTPMIKIVDSSQEFPEKDNNSDEVKRCFGANTIAQVYSQCSSQNSSSFLHTATNPTPTNPFLKTSSFSSNFSNSSENPDLNSDNSFMFAPPKLLTSFSSNNLFETSSFQSPILKVPDSIALGKC